MKTSKKMTQKKKSQKKPLVALIMGSESDWPSLEAAATVLTEFEVPFEVRVVSAHRTPEWMYRFAKGAQGKGFRVLIAGAGGAAHLPGMVASLTDLPVIGVPVSHEKLKGLDALLSIAQMPGGVPVACMAIDNSKNAGLLAVRILALSSQKLRDHLKLTAKATRKKVGLMDRNISKKSFFN